MCCERKSHAALFSPLRTCISQGLNQHRSCVAKCSLYDRVLHGNVLHAQKKKRAFHCTHRLCHSLLQEIPKYLQEEYGIEGQYIDIKKRGS